MPPKPTIDQNTVVEAAIELIRAEGWGHVSARAIAEQLGSSTMPIYSIVGSMENLKNLALGRSLELMQKRQGVRRTENVLLDMAVGYVAFAKEEPRLFTFLYSESANKMKAEEAVRLGNERNMDTIPGYAEMIKSILAEKERNALSFKGWIFTHGLAELLSAGYLEMDEEEILLSLNEAGAAFYMFEQAKGEE